MSAKAIFDIKSIKGELKARGAFCVARACFTLLDVYPGLGGAIVTSTARLGSDESNGSKA